MKEKANMRMNKSYKLGNQGKKNIMIGAKITFHEFPHPLQPVATLDQNRDSLFCS